MDRTRETASRLRLHGFTPNGRTTDGRCRECGSTVEIQHGSYPGEQSPRHLFWCAACNGYGLTFPLDDYCQHCRTEASGKPIYLIRVGGDCLYANLTTSYTVAEIQTAARKIKIVQPEPRARQLALL